MIMKKLSEDHYIVMDDSEIKEGDCIGFPNLKKFVPVQYFGGDLTGGEKKITHSTQPLGFLNEVGLTTANLKPDWTNVEYLSLSEVKELLGIVDVEKRATERYPIIMRTVTKIGGGTYHTDVNFSDRYSYKHGYNQALEDNKEKKYTEEDLKYMFECGRNYQNNAEITFKVSIQSLQPKTEWEVEFVDGKLKLK